MKRHFLAWLLVPVAAGSSAQTPDTSAWLCKRCDLPAGWQLQTDLGGGYVSDDSFKFGNYTGLDERGGFVVGDVEASYRGQANRVWRLEGTRLGLDSRRLSVEGGRQGRYELRLLYDQLPRRVFESSLSPYTNPGSAELNLPAAWVPAPATAGFTALDGSLRNAPIEWDRETFAAGVSFLQSSRLSYSLDYRLQSRDGTGLVSGGFVTQSTALPRRIDDETHIVEARVDYAADAMQLRLAYLGSFYRNEVPAQRWDNPFTAISPGADRGQLALEPDNDFHQLLLSGGYRAAGHTSVTGQLAIGRMQQDDILLPFTINPNLATPLPQSTADTRIDTLKARVRLQTRPLRRLRLRGAFTLDERDNETGQQSWNYIVSDTLPGSPRDNLPYGFERRLLELSADYRFPAGVRASAGWDRDVRKRDFSEVARTEEDALRLELDIRLGLIANLSARYRQADRELSDYQPVTQTSPPQNPLLRKYNLADRRREGFELDLDIRPTDHLDFVLTAALNQDDYRRSPLGLTEANQRAFTADVNWLIRDKVNLTANSGLEQIDSRQRGSQAFAAPDWTAANRDETVFAGLGLDLPEITSRLDARLHYYHAETTGDIDINNNGQVSAFPQLETRLHRIEAAVDYAWRENLGLSLSYAFEDYAVSDWSRDGLRPDTLATSLTTGAQWLDYDVHTVMLSFVYRPAGR